jgi:hypothetical protein
MATTRLRTSRITVRPTSPGSNRSPARQIVSGPGGYPAHAASGRDRRDRARRGGQVGPIPAGLHPSPEAASTSPPLNEATTNRLVARLLISRTAAGPPRSATAPATNATRLSTTSTSAGSSTLRPGHVRATAADWKATPVWVGAMVHKPDWVTRARERAARARASELAAHRRAEQLHEQAARLQERLGYADRAQAARERAEHARELHTEALREQAEADERTTG